MKRNVKIVLVGVICFAFIPICASIISSYYFSKASNKPVEIRKRLDVKDDSIMGTNTLSVYLETEEGSGEYKLSDEDVFLHDGYYFNEEKSKCENGGTLAYDKSTGNIRMSTVASDRCFVYFDKGVPLLHKTCNDNTLACQIAKKYGTDSTLYLHDSNLANSANDNSYRYAGASDSVNNFVCFGTDAETCPNDNLYRIIGVFDDKVKLIKYDYATSELLGTDGDYNIVVTPDATYYKGSMKSIPRYDWNKINGSSSTNDWSLSRLNKTNLNTNYLNNLGTNWTDKIVETIWNVGGIMTFANGGKTNAKTAYEYELGANKIYNTYNAKVGLMYLSEYYYSASPVNWTKPGYDSTSGGETRDYRSATTQNWMHMGFYEWTISPLSDDTTRVFVVNYMGNVNSNSVANNYAGVGGIRPVFYLNSDVLFKGGSGTKNLPFRIKI